MPIRQPYSGVSPAASACSSSVAPLLSARTPLRSKLTAPVASPSATTGAGAKSSTCSRSARPRSA